MKLLSLRRAVRAAVYAASAFLALAPGAAVAQDDPERASLRIGPVELRPRLLLSNAGIDNNVFNEHTNPKRDFTFTLSPDLEVSLHPRRLRVAYTVGSDFVYFRTYKSERSTNRSFTGRADLDLTWLKPFASYTSAHTSARPTAEIDVRARHHPRTFTAGTSVRLASRTSVTVSARESRESYDEGIRFRGVELAASLDNRTRGYESSLNFELTPFTTFSIVSARERQRFEYAPLRDADSFRIAPTLTFSPLGLITGSASVGYRRFNGLDPALPDYSGFVATGGVGILFYDRYKLDTAFTRDVRYSYERDLPYYIVAGARATLTAQTYGPIELRVLGGRESMNYRSFGAAAGPGADRLVTYGAGAGYRIGERARVVVDAEFSHRTSERDPTREYRNHRIVATLNWGALNR